MKQTLATKHSDKINRFLTNGTLDPGDYKKSLDTLHTEAVSNTIAKLGKNPILDTNPPPIASSESRLSRKQRSTLAQLRSGQCHLLNDYLVLTGRKQSALCPECLIRRHTVKHIFNCDAAPNNLTIRDLWNNPVSVIAHWFSVHSSLKQTISPPPFKTYLLRPPSGGPRETITTMDNCVLNSAAPDDEPVAQRHQMVSHSLALLLFIGQEILLGSRTAAPIGTPVQWEDIP